MAAVSRPGRVTRNELGAREVHLHLLWGSHGKDPSAEGLSLLPEAEKEEALGFFSQARRREFLWSRLFLRKVLALYLEEEPRALVFQRGARGKPHLESAGLHFNLSHTLGLMVCSLAPFPVGVDVERLGEGEEARRRARLVARRYFSESEFRRLEGSQQADYVPTFTEIFTLKEAHAKALGLGLALSGKSFTVPPAGAGGCGGWQYLSETHQDGRFCLAHAVSGISGPLRYRRVHWQAGNLVWENLSSGIPVVCRREETP